MPRTQERQPTSKCATTRAYAFCSFNITGYTLGSLLYQKHKTHFCLILPSVPSRPIAQNEFPQRLVSFSMHGHTIYVYVAVPQNREQIFVYAWGQSYTHVCMHSSVARPFCLCMCELQIAHCSRPYARREKGLMKESDTEVKTYTT